jgi:hypothetical protein
MALEDFKYFLEVGKIRHYIWQFLLSLKVVPSLICFPFGWLNEYHILEVKHGRLRGAKQFIRSHPSIDVDNCGLYNESGFAED